MRWNGLYEWSTDNMGHYVGAGYSYIGIDTTMGSDSTSSLSYEIIKYTEPSIDSRIKALKKELKYTRSVLEKKQIQQELNILYKERKNGNK
jgi:hypothetical protein